MPETVLRGYCPTDKRDFQKQLDTLRKAGRDVYYLINQGYPVKSATEFVGNHYLLSERQRLALARSISPESSILDRKSKELSHLPEGSTVHIDCFNTIISIEIAFSGSTLLLCMDGTVRDLAGLRGTYRLIDKTDMAIRAVRGVLEREKVGEAHFVLDAPVSNSGRLKERIAEIMEDSPVRATFSVIHDVDKYLYTQEAVVTGDAIILDHCRSWFNLVRQAIDHEVGRYPYIEIMEQFSEAGKTFSAREENTMQFICYPKCATCQKAKKWLDANGVAYEERHIKDEKPTLAELKAWHKQSGLPLKKFFNTSGLQYKELHLKDKLPTMSEAEQFKLLASDGMLVKRPLLVGDGFVLVGFKEEEWKARV